MKENPAIGVQKLLNQMLEKIRKIRNKFPDIDIQVDGGINDETAKLVIEAGANILVAGSYVFSGNYSEKVNSLLNGEK